MKTTIAYYLLLLYVSALFRPAFPLVSDAMAHTFSEAVHLSTVHMIYGIHHAEKEVARESASDKNTSHTSQKSAEFFTAHILLNSANYHFQRSIITTSYQVYLLCKLPAVHPLLTIPPPDFIC